METLWFKSSPVLSSKSWSSFIALPKIFLLLFNLSPCSQSVPFESFEHILPRFVNHNISFVHVSSWIKFVLQTRDLLEKCSKNPLSKLKHPEEKNVNRLKQIWNMDEPLYLLFSLQNTVISTVTASRKFVLTWFERPFSRMNSKILIWPNMLYLVGIQKLSVKYWITILVHIPGEYKSRHRLRDR